MATPQIMEEGTEQIFVADTMLGGMGGKSKGGRPRGRTYSKVQLQEIRDRFIGGEKPLQVSRALGLPYYGVKSAMQKIRKEENGDGQEGGGESRGRKAQPQLQRKLQDFESQLKANLTASVRASCKKKQLEENERTV